MDYCTPRRRASANTSTPPNTRARRTRTRTSDTRSAGVRCSASSGIGLRLLGKSDFRAFSQRHDPSLDDFADSWVIIERDPMFLRAPHLWHEEQCRVSGVDVKPDTEGGAGDDRSTDVLTVPKPLSDSGLPRECRFRTPVRIASANIFDPAHRGPRVLHRLTPKLSGPARQDNR
jgi:hypothetical protein